MAASTFSISKILSLTGETETEPRNAEMITQTAALVQPSAQAQSGSGLLWRVESPAGKEKHLESHHYDGKPGADSGTSELPSTESRKHQWRWTVMLVLVILNLQVQTYWELDMTLSTLWFFGLAEKIIT